MTHAAADNGDRVTSDPTDLVRIRDAEAAVAAADAGARAARLRAHPGGGARRRVAGIHRDAAGPPAGHFAGRAARRRRLDELGRERPAMGDGLKHAAAARGVTPGARSACGPAEVALHPATAPAPPTTPVVANPTRSALQSAPPSADRATAGPGGTLRKEMRLCGKDALRRLRSGCAGCSENHRLMGVSLRRRARVSPGIPAAPAFG
jgi:hypothetical protein